MIIVVTSLCQAPVSLPHTLFTTRCVQSRYAVRVLHVSTRRTELEVAAPYASCLIYARALLEYVIFIQWVRSFIKMLPSVIFAEDTVRVSLFSVKNAKIVQV